MNFVKKTLGASAFLLLMFSADRLSKVLMFRRPREVFDVIPGILDFRFLFNEGMAFGIPLFLPFFGLVTSALLGVLVFYLIKAYQHKELFQIVVITSILLGAISNAFDRIVYGGVIDFIHFSFWHTFNIADMMITVGVFAWLLTLLRHEKISKA